MAKTLRSRIAAVAVAVVGMGMLQATPAFATNTELTSTEVTGVTVATPSTGRVGSAFTSKVSFTVASATSGTNKDLTLRARFDSKPATSTATLAFNATDFVATLAGGATGGSTDYTAANGSGNALLPAKQVVSTTGGTFTATASVAGHVGFVPDVVGTYTVMVWHDYDGDGLIDSTEDKLSAAASFVVSAAPSKVTVTRISSTYAPIKVSTTDGQVGHLVKVTLTDSAGAAAGLAANEAIRLAAVTDVAYSEINGTSTSKAANTALDLVAADFTKGIAFINVTSDSAGAKTISFTGIGTDVESISGTFSLSYKETDNDGTSTFAVVAPASGYYATGKNVPIATSTLTFKATFSAGVDDEDYVWATVTDTAGRVAGSSSLSISGLEYDIAFQVTEGTNATTEADEWTGTFTVTMAAIAAGNSYDVVVDGGGASQTIASAAIALGSGSVSATPSGTLAGKISGSFTFAVTVKDQFKRVIPNATVKMIVTGRNATVDGLEKSATTDAAGIASFTLADAPAAGVTSLADSVTFKATEAGGTTLTSSAVTINWSTTGPSVSTITLSGPNTLETTTKTAQDINAGAGGAQGTLVTITATVKDAAGNLVAGAPVTFSVAGTGAAILSTKATGYTGAAGTVTTSLYAWLAGTYTVTATSGTVTKTDSVLFAQNTATEARTITATVAGKLVTAKVVDRFGNPIKGVKVYATRTGTGYFGNGSSTSEGTTDATGQVEFVVQQGSAATAVTVSLVDPTSVAGTIYGQSADVAGEVDETAVTAYVAGTTTVAETGVGSTFAPAGTASATVSVAALAADTTVTDLKAQVTALTTTITSIQTAISTLVASVTATLTSMSAQINKIMKKLKIK